MIHLQLRDNTDAAKLFRVELDDPRTALFHEPPRPDDNGPARLEVDAVCVEVYRGDNATGFLLSLVEESARALNWAQRGAGLDGRSAEQARTRIGEAITTLCAALTGILQGVRPDCVCCGVRVADSGRGWCQTCEDHACPECGERVVDEDDEPCWQCQEVAARAHQVNATSLADLEEQNDALLEALGEGVQP